MSKEFKLRIGATVAVKAPSSSPFPIIDSDIYRSINWLADHGLDSIEVDHGHAILGVVGDGMDSSDAYLKAAEALKDNGIQTTFVNYGASSSSVLFGVRDDQASDAVRAVYKKLF